MVKQIVKFSIAVILLLGVLVGVFVFQASEQQTEQFNEEELRYQSLPTYEDVCGDEVCGGITWSRETGWEKLEGGGVYQPSDLVKKQSIINNLNIPLEEINVLDPLRN